VTVPYKRWLGGKQISRYWIYHMLCPINILRVINLA